MKRSDAVYKLDTYLEYRTRHNQIINANVILLFIEELGMLPPETSTVSCSEPDVFLKIDSPDAGFTIPSYYILGWDDE